jgi:dipeptidyl aminopeptidase/acylaminoacyl peptidase
MVHGGPQSYFGYKFNLVQQCLASHGFLMLICNPRGSSSYGQAFASAVVGDYGGEDYHDLIAVLDIVSQRFYVDDDHVGIIGFSYGGYMAAWAIGQSSRFKAAVCGEAFVDTISLYGTADDGPA